MKQKTHLLAQVEISEGRGVVSSRPRSFPAARWTASDRRQPFRSSSMASRSSAAWKWKSMLSRSGTSLMASRRSPGASPAAAAGLRGRTWATTTPSADEGRGTGLPRRRRVEEPGSLVEVLDPRRGSEDGGRQNEKLGGRGELEIHGEHGREHREHLEEGRGLAEPRRGRVDRAAGDVDERRPQDQDHVPADDDRGDPEGHNFQVREGDEEIGRASCRE